MRNHENDHQDDDENNTNNNKSVFMYNTNNPLTSKKTIDNIHLEKSESGFQNENKQLMNSSTVSNTNSFIKRRDKIFKRHSLLEKIFGNKKEFELKQMLSGKFKILVLIDLFCVIANITVISWLYFEHFDFIENKYQISDQGNNFRIICLCIALLVCLSLLIRFYQKQKYDNLKYILNMRNSMPKIHKKNYCRLLIEIVIHLMQPYPSVVFKWNMMILGGQVTYSLNMILFSLCILRLYVVFKILRYWNTYTNEKSRYIFKFFRNRNLNLFLYKTNLKYYGFIPICIIFCSVLYIAALIFKIYENYDPNDTVGFNHLLNCIWYLIETMTTIGYGDYVPKTMIGRMIGVVCCIIGIFVLSLLTVTLILFLTIESDAENKAYYRIELLHTQGKKNNFFSNYFDNFIRYKMNRIRQAKYVTNQVSKYFLYKNRFKISHEKDFLRIRASTKETLTVPEFCKNVREEWESFFNDTKYDLEDTIGRLYPRSSYMTDNVYLYTKTIKNSKLNSFKIANLIKFMNVCGNPFEISTIGELKGDTIVSNKNIYMHLKEFHIKHKDKALFPRISKNKTLSNLKNHNDNDEDDSEEKYNSDGSSYEYNSEVISQSYNENASNVNDMTNNSNNYFY